MSDALETIGVIAILLLIGSIGHCSGRIWVNHDVTNGNPIVLANTVYRCEARP